MRSLVLPLVVAGLLASVACGRTPLAPSSSSTAGSPNTDSPAASVGGSVNPSARGGGGGKPPSLERPVAAELRCADDGCTDGIRSDGAPYNVMLGGDGNLAFSLANYPDRSVVFDFGDCVADCTGGNRWFTSTAVGAANSLWMHTSVLIPGTENETAQGFHDIPVGATWFSRIKILFRVWDASNTEFAWAIRYNPFFQGSTNLQVTRLAEDQWRLEALPSQTAWTQSVEVTKRQRDRVEVFEGNYRLPFAMTIQVQ